jgi:hypothetical protein
MTGSPRMLQAQRHMLTKHREHSPNNFTFELSEFIKTAEEDYPNGGGYHHAEGWDGYIGFLKGMLKTYSGCSFLIGNVGNNWDGDYSRAVRSNPNIHMYIPSNRFTSGWVGFGDFRLGDEVDAQAPDTIGVWSPHIGKANVNSYNMQHCLMTTTNPTRALKNARRFFKAESPVDVARVGLLSDVADAVSNVVHETHTLLRRSKDKVIDHSGLTTELRHLQERGYKFTDLDFAEMVAEYLEEVAYTEAQATKITLLSVRLYMVGDEQRFDCVRFTDCQDRYNVGLGTRAGEAVTYTEAELPEFIPRKISILMMSDTNTFVSGVGYKLDEEMYYVVED